MTPAERTRAAITPSPARVRRPGRVRPRPPRNRSGRGYLVVSAAIPVLALLNVPGFRNRTGEPDDPDE